MVCRHSRRLRGSPGSRGGGGGLWDHQGGGGLLDYQEQLGRDLGREGLLQVRVPFLSAAHSLWLSAAPSIIPCLHMVAWPLHMGADFGSCDGNCVCDEGRLLCTCITPLCSCRSFTVPEVSYKSRGNLSYPLRRSRLLPCACSYLS